MARPGCSIARALEAWSSGGLWHCIDTSGGIAAEAEGWAERAAVGRRDFHDGWLSIRLLPSRNWRIVRPGAAGRSDSGRVRRMTASDNGGN